MINIKCCQTIHNIDTEKHTKSIELSKNVYMFSSSFINESSWLAGKQIPEFRKVSSTSNATERNHFRIIFWICSPCIRFGFHSHLSLSLILKFAGFYFNSFFSIPFVFWPVSFIFFVVAAACCREWQRGVSRRSNNIIYYYWFYGTCWWLLLR